MKVTGDDSVDLWLLLDDSQPERPKEMSEVDKEQYMRAMQLKSQRIAAAGQTANTLMALASFERYAPDWPFGRNAPDWPSNEWTDLVAEQIREHPEIEARSIILPPGEIEPMALRVTVSDVQVEIALPDIIVTTALMIFDGIHQDATA